MNRKLLPIAILCFQVLPLSAGEWKPLWNGRTLDGWHITGKGSWKIEEGAIHGTQAQAEKEYGHLVTDRAFGDFSVRLQFKAVKGNSGLYFRSEEKGFSGITGFQAEIDATRDTGGLYETNGRRWVVQPSAEAVAGWFKAGDWNEMTVTAKGTSITVTVNGRTSAVLTNDPGRKDGKFALQLHAGKEMDVWFKDIEVMESP